MTGVSFLLVGLELRPILDSLTNRTSGSLALESLAVVGVVIVVRMVWMFGATALPGGQRLFGATEPDGRSWRETTVVGWAGMRGAVSLAAALALPQDFPQRDLIIFLTFSVIVATLVGQGLTLPPLIRRLGLVTRDQQDLLLTAEARRRLTVVALGHIDDVSQSDQFPEEVVDRLRTGYESQLARIDRRLEVIGADNGSGNGLGMRPTPRPPPSPSRPSVTSACRSSPPSGPSSTSSWPAGASPTGWPTRCGPPSTSTRRPCDPEVVLQ